MEPRFISSRGKSILVSIVLIEILQRAKKTFWIDFYQDSVHRIVPQTNNRTQLCRDLFDQASSIGRNGALEPVYARSAKYDLKGQAFSRSFIMEV